jgi:multiple antibiotic resistance protein
MFALASLAGEGFTNEVFRTLLLFILLINPVSKIGICFSLRDSMNRSELRRLALRSNLIGLVTLVVFALAGTFIVRNLFQIELYSLQLAGGAVLFIVGLHALQSGEFFEMKSGMSLQDISCVPIAMPLIAGPATITAAISKTAAYGPLVVTLSLLLATGINLFIMIYSMGLGKFLDSWKLLGPLVRITGLFIAAIGADMILNGLSQWISSAGIGL